MKLRSMVLATICIAAITATSHAASLYQTGWEPSPASPAWTTSNISGQNAWVGVGLASGHQVVGSGVNVGGVIVNATQGTRMHQSQTGGPGTFSYTWRDVSGAWAARPVGENTAIGEMDIFIPSTDSTNDVAHGALMFGSDASASLIGGWVVANNGRGLFMYDGGGNVVDPNVVIPADTWTHISFAANFGTSQLALYVNDNLKAVGTFAPAAVVGLGDFDLYNENFGVSGGTGSRIFTDNFGVSTAPGVPEPTCLAAVLLVGTLFRRRHQ